MNKTIFYLGIILLPMIGYYTVAAQTSDQSTPRMTLQTFFDHIDGGDLDVAEEILRDDAVIFDSAHMLRFDGKMDYFEYLSANFPEENERIKTSIRQPVMHMIGQAAVLNFYFSRTYFTDQDDTGVIDEEDDPIDGLDVWGDEVGRGTAVFVREQGIWKVVSLHLSEVTTGAFE